MGTTVESQNMPDWAEPYALSYLAKAQKMSNPDTTIYSTKYSGETYAPQNANETDGIQAIIDRGKNHSPVVESARQLLRNIVSGANVSVNPKVQPRYTKQVDAIIKSFKEETLATIDDEAARLLSWGSSGHAIRKAKATEDVVLALLQLGENLFYDDYEIEQQRRAGLLWSVIPLSHETIKDLELIRSGCLYDREWRQGRMEDYYRLWVSEQGDEATKMDIHGNAVRSLVGSFSTETRPFYRPGGFAQFAGMATAGAGLISGYLNKPTPQPQISNSSSQTSGKSVLGWNAPNFKPDLSI